MAGTKIPKDPNFSKGVNLSGFDASAILTKFNQVAVVNGSQKIILSTDTAESGALNDAKKLAAGGALTTLKPPTGGGASSANTTKPAGGKSKTTTYLIIGGAALAGLVILFVVYKATRKG